MRKIESNMNAAIKGNANWKNANTQVITEGTLSKVYLHGNLIAKVGDDFVTIFDGGWQSNTTKSRLNAIINEFCCAFTDGVFQKDFAWYIRDNKVTHDFVDGYTFCEFAWVTTISPSYRRFMTTNPVERWGFLLLTVSSLS